MTTKDTTPTPEITPEDQKAIDEQAKATSPIHKNYAGKMSYDNKFIKAFSEGAEWGIKYEMNLTGSHDRIVAQSERIKELESRLEISYKGFDQVESFRHSSTVERDYLRGRVKELEAEVAAHDKERHEMYAAEAFYKMEIKRLAALQSPSKDTPDKKKHPLLEKLRANTPNEIKQGIDNGSIPCPLEIVNSESSPVSVDINESGQELIYKIMKLTPNRSALRKFMRAMCLEFDRHQADLSRAQKPDTKQSGE
jgi:hypothetical protein